MNRFDAVRELVKDPSLRITDIAKQTGYNKGHVSRLRKESDGAMTKLEAWKAWCESAGTPDLATEFTLEQSSHGKAFSFAWERGFVDGMQHQMQLHVNRVIKDGPTAWQCQCGKAYTVTCISSKPSKREWVSLTDEEVCNAIDDVLEGGGWLDVARALEAAIKEKNHG